MFAFHTLIRKANICLAIVVAVTPVLHPGSAASGAGATPRETAGRQGVQMAVEPEQVAAYTQTATQDDTVQSVLNLMVRTSLSAAGWRIASLDIDEASLQATESGLAGAGKWRVEARDEQEQTQSLDGSLNFSLEGQAQGSQGFAVMSGLSALADATGSIKGDLHGMGVEAALELNTSVVRQGDTLDQKADVSLHLVRDGNESDIKASGTGQIRPVAYNIQELVSHSTVERDGKRAETTQTAIVRAFGKGESEVWVEASGASAADQHAQATTRQHFFQRISGNNVTEYLDQFDLTTPKGNYALKSPASISATLGGDRSYRLTLVGSNGNTLELPASNPGSRHVGLSSPLSVSTNDSNAWSLQQQTKPGGNLASDEEYRRAVIAGLATVAGLTGLGLGLSGVIAAGAALEEAQQYAAGSAAAEQALATAAAEEESSIVGSTVAGGAGLVNGAALSNGDPFFVIPDVRARTDPSSPGPVQITRVTGGLVATVLTPTSSLTATAAPTDAITPTLSANENTQYNDDPVPFVGGSLPLGAQPKGEWAWDAERSYGAMPAHTRAQSDGSQLHYFIHASSPLTISKDTNLVQYVYLDPQNPPREIYLQLYTGDGDGEHRAYWGDDLVQTGGEGGKASLYPMGALPQAGGWVRLQLPADKVGLVDRPVNGILYGAYGGKTWWGPTTTSNRLTDSAPDRIVVQPPQTVPTTTHGSQIAFRLAEPLRLSVEIVDAQGKSIRSLIQEEEQQAGYQVVVWNAKDDGGSDVPDVTYKVRFTANGNLVAEHQVTITPLVANIEVPGAYSLVRGNQVPVVGEAYGQGSANYKLEYGKGLNPASWEMIATSNAPALLPNAQQLRTFNPGNIANWNVGINEFIPWKDEGLSGVYTLRLTVTGKDGRQTSDSFPVVVGRLAHTAEGGKITSPDGKASLTIPPLATEEPFALMGLVSLPELEPDEGWKQNLPVGSKLVGEVYEVLPPNETFRRPATLELPYSGSDPPERVGILLGDGTRDGWRYIGGKADSAKGTVSVTLTDFGGGRVLVAAFASDNFGQPPTDPAASARLSLDPATLAPLVQPGGLAPAFYADLESSAGEYEALDIYGTRLERIEGGDADTAAGNHVLKVTRLPDGERLLRVRSTPYDAAKYPLLSFDYRLPSGYAPDLFVRSNGKWWQVQMGTSRAVVSSYFSPTQPPEKLVTDDKWHHYQLDLLALLTYAQHQATGFQVDEIVLGQMNRIAYMQVQIVDSGEVGSAYYLDNFAALSPTNSTSLSFTWTPPSGVTFAGYAFALDDKSDTIPAEREQTTSTSTTIAVPPTAPDGTLYFHLRGRGATGVWSATTHVPLLLDRQPPRVGRVDPPPGGAGSPDFIAIALADGTSGVSPASLRVRINGQTYGVGRGVAYDPFVGTLTFSPGIIEPALPRVANGQKVDMALVEATDYAGNKLASPYQWSFTADRPQASGAEFKQLTTGGGHSPTLSPDGNMLAFVSARSGQERVWVMKTEDVEEKTSSAVQLTSGTDTQADPAWSPDDKLIAYVSDAGGSQQLWVAASDGSGAHSLTAGQGGAASPTWLSEGDNTQIFFVRDGNIWSVAPDGTDLRAITNYPERPIRSVRVQPRGGGQYLAVGFKLYEETVQLFDLVGGELRPVTHGGRDGEPAWLNGSTLLYTAPASENQPDAIWQVGTDGEGSTILQGSAQPGVADMEPAVSSDGSVLAVTSTRGGERNVWVRQMSQVALLQVSPGSGALPGQTISISYALPTSSTVNLTIVDGAGTLVRALVHDESKPKGAQQLTWDGTDASGNAVAPGNYTVQLSAKVAGGGELTRYATVLFNDPVKHGTLQLEIQQWAGEPVRPNRDLQTLIYAQGRRTAPVAQASGTSNPSFDLQTGRYDVVVEYGGEQNETRSLDVEAGKTTSKVIDLNLGALEVLLVTAPGQPVQTQAYIGVSRSGDPTGAALQTSYSGNETFLLPAGIYDVRAEYGGIEKEARGLVVKSAQTTHKEINLESGTVSVTVYSKDGHLAEVGRVAVTAYDAKNHQSMATSYDNPAQLLLPAGRYDLRIEYSLRAPGYEPVSLVGGSTTAWIYAVDIQAGLTVTREHNLRLTPATIKIEEAQDKAPPEGSISFFIYPSGEHKAEIAAALTDTAHLELPEGIYDVVPSYGNIEHGPDVFAGLSFEVKYGQPVEHTFNLGLGHAIIEVSDTQGQLVDKEQLFALAYPSGQRDTPFAEQFGSNPLDLPLRANTDYDIVVRLTDGRSYVIDRQHVKEGESLTLKLSVQDIKP